MADGLEIRVYVTKGVRIVCRIFYYSKEYSMQETLGEGSFSDKDEEFVTC